MSDRFDMDGFLALGAGLLDEAGTAPTPTATTERDPLDAFLNGEIDAREYLEADTFPLVEDPGGTLAQSAKTLFRGATAEGLYAGEEGVLRGLAGVIRPSAEERARAGRFVEEGMGPLGKQLPFLEAPHRQEAEEMFTGEHGRDALADKFEAFADGVAAVREDVREALPVEPAFLETFGAQILQGIGQAAGTLPLYAVPGLGPAHTAGMIYDEAYRDATRHGQTPAEAHQAAVKNLPAAVFEVLTNKLHIGTILKPLQGKVTVGEMVRSVAVVSAAEGITEGAQQAWLNLVARSLAGYDPERKLDDEVINSVLVGAAVGGVVSATGQSGARILSEVSGEAAVDRSKRRAETQTQIEEDLAAAEQTATVEQPAGPPEIPSDTQVYREIEADLDEAGRNVVESKLAASQLEEALGRMEIGKAEGNLRMEERARIRKEMGVLADKPLHEWKEEALRKWAERNYAPAQKELDTRRQRDLATEKSEQSIKEMKVKQILARGQDYAEIPMVDLEFLATEGDQAAADAMFRREETEGTVDDPADELDQALRRIGGIPTPRWEKKFGQYEGELQGIWESHKHKKIWRRREGDYLELDKVAEQLREAGFSQVWGPNELLDLLDERYGANPKKRYADHGKLTAGRDYFNAAGEEIQMSRVTRPWPKHFRGVATLSSGRAYTGHPAFTAAKAGDTSQADALVNDLVKEDRLREQLKPLLEGEEEILILPVHAVEQTGRNKTPWALAKKIAQITGWEIEETLAQINVAGHTGASAIQRVVRQPEFDGEVEEGRSYVLVDDMVTSGSTFNALRNYIEERGGKVVQAVVLGDTYNRVLGRSSRLPVQEETLARVRERLADPADTYPGESFDRLLQQFNIAENAEALTESQLKYFGRHASLERLRDRLATEGGPGFLSQARRETGRRPQGAGEESPRDSGGEELTESLAAAPAGIMAADVRRTIDPILARWDNAPVVRVVQHEDELSARLRQQMHRQQAAAGDLEGFLDNGTGTVYLIANNLADPERARQVLFHESVAHFGLRELLGSELDSFLQQVAAKYGGTDTYREIVRDYGFDADADQDRLQIAEEIVARMAEGNVSDPTLWQRLVEILQKWMRRHGWDTPLTENEIRSALAASRRQLEGATQGRESPQLTLPAEATIPLESPRSRIPEAGSDSLAARARKTALEFLERWGITEPKKRASILASYRQTAHTLLNASAAPYGQRQTEIDFEAAAEELQNPRDGQSVDDRRRIASYFEDVERHHEDLGDALRARGRVSSILHEFVGGRMPSADLRGRQIESPRDFAAAASVFRNPFQEVLGVAVLNERGEILRAEPVTVGLVSSSLGSPRVVSDVLQRVGTEAKEFIVWHNHPSGRPNPSQTDLKLKQQIEEASYPHGATMRDFIVLDGDRFYSSVEGRVVMEDLPRAAWEGARRHTLRAMVKPEDLIELVGWMRPDGPGVNDVYYLTRSNHLTAIARIKADSAEEFTQRIIEGAVREGSSAVLVSGDFFNSNDAAKRAHDLAAQLYLHDVDLLDIYAPAIDENLSLSDMGVMEDEGPNEFQRRPFNARIRNLQDQLDGLNAAVRRAEAAGRKPHQDVLGRRAVLKTELLDLIYEIEGRVPGMSREGRVRAWDAPAEQEELKFSRTDAQREIEAATHRTPLMPERWWQGFKRWMQGFSSDIPELPVLHGAERKTAEFAQFRQGYRLMAAAQESIRKESEETVAEILQPLRELGRQTIDPDLMPRYRKLVKRYAGLKEKGGSTVQALEQIGEAEKQLDANPFYLFQQAVLYRDLWFRSLLTTKNGEPMRLPGGMTPEEVRLRIKELHGLIYEHPHREAIEKSLQGHYAEVSKLQREILDHGHIIPEEMRNPLYYPHLVLDQFSGRIDPVRATTAADFRAYLIEPEGSAKRVEADYLKALYYHIAQVRTHNARQDIVEQYWQPYDRAQKHQNLLETDAAADNAGSVEPDAWKNPRNWPEGYVLYTVDDALPLRMDYLLDRSVLAERLAVELGAGDLRERLKEAGVSDMTIRAEDLQAALSVGEKKQWLIPVEIAKALHGIRRRDEARSARRALSPSGVSRSIMRAWKLNILFAPWNYIRYEFNNTMADLEKLWSMDWNTFSYLKEAMGEVRQFLHGGEASRDLQQAYKRGVVDSVTVNEVGDLRHFDQFAEFITSGDLTLEKVRTAFRWTMPASRLREATFRYAKFKADLERIRNGAAPVYAGAYWKDAEAQGDPYSKAAYISRRTFGDYQDISVSGQWMREHLVPFYSWIEINFRYHANLFRNMKDMLALSRWRDAKQIAAGGIRHTPAVAMGVLLRLALPYVAIQFWNDWGGARAGLWDEDDDLEGTLSAHDRRRFHIILGKDENGKTKVVYTPTAFSDVVEWFGGANFIQLAMEFGRGDITLDRLITDFGKQGPADVLNKAVGGIRPEVKALYTAASRKNIFPDVLDQRTVSRDDVGWVILSSMTDRTIGMALRNLLDKDYYSPNDFNEWWQQALLQIRRRDPEMWAYYEIKDKASDFVEERTGQIRGGFDYYAPDQQTLRSFRRAMFAADVPAAIKFYNRLLGLGYSRERFAQSIRANSPLHGLRKDLRRPFVDSLTEFEKGQLQRAAKFYSRIALSKGKEKLLFPSERWPGHQFRPRPDVLRSTIRQQGAMGEADATDFARKFMEEAMR